MTCAGQGGKQFTSCHFHISVTLFCWCQSQVTQLFAQPGHGFAEHRTAGWGRARGMVYRWSLRGQVSNGSGMLMGLVWNKNKKKTIIKTPIMGNMICGDPVCEGPSPERVIRIKSKWSRLIWKKNVVRTPQDLLIRLLIDMRDNTTRINF